MSKKTFKLLGVIFGFVTLTFINFNAYADSTTGQWWLNGGLGEGGNDDHFGGPAGYGSFNYRVSEHQLLTARATTIEQVNVGEIVECLVYPSGTNCYSKDGRQNDYGVLYGLIAKGQYAYVSGSAGLALVNGTNEALIVNNQTVDGGQSYSTIGIPVEAQAFITPLPYVGVGLVGFGDINNKKSVAGVALAIQIGKLN